MTHGKRRRERGYVFGFFVREESREICVRFRARQRERGSLSLKAPLRLMGVFSLFFFASFFNFVTWGRNIIIIMGKTGTEKPLKAPKKKQKELDEDDLAALARKKEEQAKLNALKKQVAGGAKLGKGLSKSK